MPAAQKRRPARAGRKPTQAAPPNTRVKNAGKAGIEGSAGVAPEANGGHVKAQRSGFGGERTSSEVNDTCASRGRDTELARTISSAGGAPGRPREYATPEELEEAVEAYFDGITRTVNVVELVDSGRRDDNGHVVYEPVQIKNDNGELIRKTEYVLPPTVTDLCLCLGITRQTWANYSHREGYRRVTERAKTRMMGYLERELLTRTKGIQGVIFNLEHNHDWKEKKGADRPMDSFDLSRMTDEELLAMAAQCVSEEET